MQREFVSSADVDRILPSSASPLLFVPPDLGISSPSYLTNGCDFPALSPQISDPTPNEYTVSPSPISFDDEDPVTLENRCLNISRLALQYQKIADRYEFFLSQLQQAERETENITQQNANIHHTNEEFYRQLSLISAKHKYRNPMFLLDGHFRRLALANPPDEASPTSVFGFHENRLGTEIPCVDHKRQTLPKSISIRSTSYLKINQFEGSCSESKRHIRPRPTTPLMQKVRLGGAEKIEGSTTEGKDAVEVDVYSQGMFKTELCNKWQETGECPYGEHCQFAHGIGELRPIIRHPRYKTQLCRMILTGDTCPYGHRCHFRHSITPQDRLPRPN